jgi:Ca2+-binding EF-hand superfamily protein
MKFIPTTAAALLLGLTSASLAQEKKARGEGGRRPSREDMLERFDLDKDGELSEEERKTAREARPQQRGPNRRPAERKPHGESGGTQHSDERRNRHIEKFDINKDGKLSEEERRLARDEIAKGFGQRGDKMREHMLKKFDEDGDGKLSEEERQQAHKEMRRNQDVISDRMTKAKKRLMMRFDTDGDGKISEEEKMAAKKLIEHRIGEIKLELIRKYDADGDGKLSKEERRTAHEEEKQKMLDRFDLDKDGELNGKEKKAAFEYMMEHQPYRLMHQMKGQRGRPKHGNRDGKPQARDGRRDSPQRP